MSFQPFQFHDGNQMLPSLTSGGLNPYGGLGTPNQQSLLGQPLLNAVPYQRELGSTCASTMFCPSTQHTTQQVNMGSPGLFNTNTNSAVSFARALTPIQHHGTLSGNATPVQQQHVLSNLTPTSANPQPQVGTPTTSANGMGTAQTSEAKPAPDPNTCANVFVASLPSSYDDKMLNELFLPFGSIVSAKVSRDLATGNSRSFGFVLFEHPESAQRAIASLHNTRIKGAGTSKLHVTLSSHNENQCAAECERLYVRNLPQNATTEALIAVFSPYGTVLEANIHGNASSGAPSAQSPSGAAQSQSPSGQRSTAGNMAVGFVRMATVEEARKAIEKVHNTKPFDSDNPILVRFMETPDMKAARRRSKETTFKGERDSEGGASGRTSVVSRNSPDHLAASASASSYAMNQITGNGSPHHNANGLSIAPPLQLAPPMTTMSAFSTHQMSPLHMQPALAPAPFPTYGDIYMLGAASEPIARFVFGHAGYTVAMCAHNGTAHFIRLADPIQHERAASELNNVILSDGNTLRVVTLVPPTPKIQSQPATTITLPPSVSVGTGVRVGTGSPLIGQHNTNTSPLTAVGTTGGHACLMQQQQQQQQHQQVNNINNNNNNNNGVAMSMGGIGMGGLGACMSLGGLGAVGMGGMPPSMTMGTSSPLSHMTMMPNQSQTFAQPSSSAGHSNMVAPHQMMMPQ